MTLTASKVNAREASELGTVGLRYVGTWKKTAGGKRGDTRY
jgi:hypothetical protein